MCSSRQRRRRCAQCRARHRSTPVLSQHQLRRRLGRAQRRRWWQHNLVRLRRHRQPPLSVRKRQRLLGRRPLERLLSMELLLEAHRSPQMDSPLHPLLPHRRHLRRMQSKLARRKHLTQRRLHPQPRPLEPTRRRDLSLRRRAQLRLLLRLRALLSSAPRRRPQWRRQPQRRGQQQALRRHDRRARLLDLRHRLRLPRRRLQAKRRPLRRLRAADSRPPVRRLARRQRQATRQLLCPHTSPLALLRPTVSGGRQRPRRSGATERSVARLHVRRP